ncbi:helix-turn-helix domain-containing protein [Pseudonocardia nigra]|uniref:helix-turn-helix domain-containing protein n=1 Tax=Pseudonocardia nigra TaxID=1921578 RepID=UPI001C5CC682|nr:helix-turn-helix domain-containing protein [Pseudonocardia nigra]
MTAAELRALPAAVPLWPTAARALGLGRTTAYKMVQAGEWPTRLLRLGNAYRVPTAELLALLGVDEQRSGDEPQGAA